MQRTNRGLALRFSDLCRRRLGTLKRVVLVVSVSVAAFSDRSFLPIHRQGWLLSGAIAFAKEELKKEFWLSGVGDTVSADLQSYADRMIWLDESWTEFSKV